MIDPITSDPLEPDGYALDTRLPALVVAASLSVAIIRAMPTLGTESAVNRPEPQSACGGVDGLCPKIISNVIDWIMGHLHGLLSAGYSDRLRHLCAARLIDSRRLSTIDSPLSVSVFSKDRVRRPSVARPRGGSKMGTSTGPSDEEVSRYRRDGFLVPQVRLPSEAIDGCWPQPTS